MAKVAFLSPMPPAETGVATYAASVLRQLRDSPHRVEPLWPIRRDADRTVWEADLAVYHVGNNVRFHRDIYTLAIRHPGLVVLHDLALDDLVAGLIELEDPLGPRTRLEAQEAAPRLQGSGLELDPPLRTPWPALIARRARGIIVHSEFARRYLEAFGCRTPVFVAPHTAFEEPGGLRMRRAQRRVAGRLGEGGAPLVGVLGDVGGAKGIDAVLRASRLIEDPHRLAVVGRRIPGFDAAAAVRAAGVAGRTLIAEDVTDHEFWAWLRACDVVINLRYPHRGEVSGTLARAMQVGKPTIVSGVGTYLDLPEGTVVPVPAGPADPVEIARALRGLLRDPDERETIGRRARDHVEDLRRTREAARVYTLAIDETLALMRDPARAAVARWAGALTDLGASSDNLRAGLGARYLDAMEELEPRA